MLHALCYINVNIIADDDSDEREQKGSFWDKTSSDVVCYFKQQVKGKAFFDSILCYFEQEKSILYAWTRKMKELTDQSIVDGRIYKNLKSLNSFVNFCYNVLSNFVQLWQRVLYFDGNLKPIYKPSKLRMGKVCSEKKEENKKKWKHY